MKGFQLTHVIPLPVYHSLATESGNGCGTYMWFVLLRVYCSLAPLTFAWSLVGLAAVPAPCTWLGLFGLVWGLGSHAFWPLGFHG